MPVPGRDECLDMLVQRYRQYEAQAGMMSLVSVAYVDHKLL